MALRLVLIVTFAIGLSACATSGYEVGQRLPQALGGASHNIPPPRGTPEYDAWLKQPEPNEPKITPQ